MWGLDVSDGLGVIKPIHASLLLSGGGGMGGSCTVHWTHKQILVLIKKIQICSRPEKRDYGEGRLAERIDNPVKREDLYTSGFTEHIVPA